MKNGMSRFWYRFRNWFRIKPGPGEPLTFSCGSEKELRRVTTWICHVRPQIFIERKAIFVGYGICDWETYQMHGYIGGAWQSDGSLRLIGAIPPKEYEYSKIWCSWIVQHNTFRGTEWVRYDGGWTQWVRPNRGWYEMPVSIGVTVHPPSARERAEALLALSEWLDGKVSEEEKRELLQLPDYFEF